MLYRSISFWHIIIYFFIINHDYNIIYLKRKIKNQTIILQRHLFHLIQITIFFNIPNTMCIHSSFTHAISETSIKSLSVVVQIFLSDEF